MILTLLLSWVRVLTAKFSKSLAKPTIKLTPLRKSPSKISARRNRKMHSMKSEFLHQSSMRILQVTKSLLLIKVKLCVLLWITQVMETCTKRQLNTRKKRLYFLRKIFGEHLQGRYKPQLAFTTLKFSIEISKVPTFSWTKRELHYQAI